MKAEQMQRPVGNDEFAAFALRIARAMARRIEDDGDIEVLVKLEHLEHTVKELVNDAIENLHRSGYSYAEIGARLGMSRQAVRQRVTP